MPLLACISVYKCELCERIHTCKSVLDYASFERTWFDGWKFSICFECREKPEAVKLIGNDRALTRAIDKSVRKYFTPEMEVRHVN